MDENTAKFADIIVGIVEAVEQMLEHSNGSCSTSANCHSWAEFNRLIDELKTMFVFEKARS